MRYNFFWKGSERGVGGVGIFVAEQYIDKVVQAKRASYRVIVLKVLIGKIVLNVIFALYHRRVDQMRRRGSSGFCWLKLGRVNVRNWLYVVTLW